VLRSLRFFVHLFIQRTTVNQALLLGARQGKYPTNSEDVFFDGRIGFIIVRDIKPLHEPPHPSYVQSPSGLNAVPYGYWLR
jgi:hypothetical protein